MRVLFFPYSDKNPYQRLLAKSLKRQGLSVTFDKKAFSLTALLVRPLRFEILHLHWTPVDLPRKIVLVVKILLLRLRGGRVVWTVHNLIPHEKRATYTELMYLKLLAKLMDRIVVFCDKASERVVRKYSVTRSKVQVTPHGNYIGLLDSSPSQKEAREKLGIETKMSIFLYFGLIREYKGVTNLIRAFRKLDALARLIIAGEPHDEGMRKKLSDLSAGDERILLKLRYIEEEELGLLLIACDFVV